LEKNEIEILLVNFNDLDEILNADERDLKRVLKKAAEQFKKEMNALREQIMVGKKI
jgi:hypothetical protein